MGGIRRFSPGTKNESPRNILPHKGDRLLPEMNHKSSSEFAPKKLRKNDIEVRL
jgi:hypothetical protein